MRFSVYKYPKLNFYGLIGVFSAFAAIVAVLAAVLLSRESDGFWIGICVFGFLLLFPIVLLVLTVRQRADYLAEFSFDGEGLTLYHQKSGVQTIPWSEVADSGILEKRYESTPSSHPKFIYFSKTKLAKKDKLRMNCCVKADLLCVECRDEILWAVQKYFPISLEVEKIRVPRHITNQDLEDSDE